MPLPSQSVSVRPPSDQAFFAFAIAGLSCTLSLWLTLRLCRHLWPGEGSLLLVLLGLSWESAKLYFGPIGLRGLGVGGPGQRLGSLMLATMALVLMAGSVVASMAYLSQADAQDQQRVLTSSRAYAEAKDMLRSLDAQIGVLSVAAARDVDHNFRKRALATSEAISDLRRQRREASAAIAKMEAHPEALATAPFFASLGASLPGDADANGKRIRCGAHAVIAVMLELIGVAALCVARMHSATIEPVQRDATGRLARLAKIFVRASDHRDVPVHPVDMPTACSSTSMYTVDAPAACTNTAASSAAVSVFCPSTSVYPVDVPTACTSTLVRSADVPAARASTPVYPADVPVANAGASMYSTNVPAAVACTSACPTDVPAACASTPVYPADASVANAGASMSSTNVPAAVACTSACPTDVPGACPSALVYPTDVPAGSTSTSMHRADAPDHVENVFVNMVASRSRPPDARRRRSGRHSEKPTGKIQDAKNLVLQGQVAPTYRALKQACNMGQALSSRVLEELHALGRLKRVGRRLELVA